MAPPEAVNAAGNGGENVRTVAVVVMAVLGLTSCRSVQPPEAGFLNRSVTVGEQRYPYVVWVPPSTPAGPRPVILFLHGAGERGNDGWRQTAVGIGSAIRWDASRFAEALVVMPQAPEGEAWLGEPSAAAMAALRRTVEEFAGDPDRIYLTGLSLGGYGAWFLATEYPDTFAAIVPVCGGVVAPPSARNVRDHPRGAGLPDPYAAVAAVMPPVPIWIFHGADDPIIPASESRRMREALEAVGKPVRYTEFPAVGHNVWDPAYGQPELWRWMLAQRRELHRRAGVERTPIPSNPS